MEILFYFYKFKTSSDGLACLLSRESFFDDGVCVCVPASACLRVCACVCVPACTCIWVKKPALHQFSDKKLNKM